VLTAYPTNRLPDELAPCSKSVELDSLAHSAISASIAARRPSTLGFLLPYVPSLGQRPVAVLTAPGRSNRTVL
jgi:hypothetical protein